MIWENPIQHITGYHTPYFQAQWWRHHVMGMLVIVKDWGVCQDKKRNRIELSTGKILQENLVQSAFYQTL
jgi:hypothetical protein